MTSIELITELNNCLGTATQERNEYRDGLNQFAKQFKTARNDLRKLLRNETSKTRRKLLKKDLRKVELVYQRLQ